MTEKLIKTYFWDTCVFYAFLGNLEEMYDIQSIQQYIDECRRGEVKIISSTIVLAELRPSIALKSRSMSVDSFFSMMSASVVLMSPDPNIMRLAAQLRDLPYKRDKSTKRQLSTPDAIHLATCVHATEYHNVSIAAFHTFDNGGKRDEEGGKTVPLIDFHKWCDGFEQKHWVYASKVVNLKRCRPTHPSPKLPLEKPTRNDKR